MLKATNMATSTLLTLRRGVAKNRHGLLQTINCPTLLYRPMTSSASAIPARPPMPRVLPGTKYPASKAAASAVASDNDPPKRRPILMGLGVTLLSLCLIDSWLVHQEKAEKDERMKQLSREEADFRQQLLDEWRDKPTLAFAKTIIKYKMGGTMGLRDVDVGDMVEVLQRNVGPTKLYALCRTRDAESGEIASIGWYPMEFMEEISEASTATEKRRKFLGLF